MARAVIQLAAIATCVVLSLTAEDRQARSGDLDRGPSLGRDVHRAIFLGREGLSYNLGEVRGHAAADSEEDILRLPSRGVAAAAAGVPLQRYNFEQGNIAIPGNYQGPYLIGHIESYAATRENEHSGEPSISDVNNNYDLGTLNGRGYSGSSASSPQFSGSNDYRNTPSYNLNLKFKSPLRENASPIPLTEPVRSSLHELRNRQVVSSDLKHIGNTNINNTPEISFEEGDEEAMALKKRFEMSTEFFIVPSSSTSATTSTAATYVAKSMNSAEPDKVGGVFRNEVWVVPVLALSAITMVLIAGFEIFVLCKAWRTTPSRRHLFLGQMLLLGLFSCAGLGSIFAASPTQFTCALMRFGTGVAYAIVFASLLVKCVFLISLNGGVYLPAPYQGLLLLFAILIQVAIGVQWLLTSPPLIDIMTVEHVVHQNRNRLLVTAADITTTQLIPLCRTPYVDILLSLIYVIFLIIFVTVLAVKSRGIRDNYREATYIGLSIGCSIPTWLIWTISGLVMNERHRDACIAFGLVITSIMVFLIMFMPKGRQLAAMGKEGVYIEDREERFSSLSRAGSGYSPSFFHFKPIKYGMNHATKQPPIATLRAGDLALGPAPPSYTRLFQYPPGYYSTRYLPDFPATSMSSASAKSKCGPFGGLYLRPDDGNLYTTLEPTLSSNPNVYFQRGNGLHPGMMY